MTSTSRHDAADSLTIPPPNPDRPPLRANLFHAMQKGNTQLMPLFPYLYAGAFVPAGAIIRGGPDMHYGHFFHHNTVDEVVIAWATNGALLKTGQVFVGGRVHGVDSFLKNESDPDSYAIMCITQRQSEGGPQTEAVSLQCTKCRERIFFFEFDVTPAADTSEADQPFETLIQSEEACRKFNEDIQARTCEQCGHVNDPFPIEAWGWHLYSGQSATVLKGRDEISHAAGQQLRPADAPA
jgi:hypothetical protein